MSCRSSLKNGKGWYFNSWVERYQPFSFCLIKSREVRNYYFLPWTSSETVNFLRPFARRAANTRRPLAVSIRWRKPCLLFLLRLWGWNVLFIFVMLFFCFWYTYHWAGKVSTNHCIADLAASLFYWGTFSLRVAKLGKLLWMSKICSMKSWFFVLLAHCS